MRDSGFWICFALGNQPSKRFYFLRCILNDESHSGNHRPSHFLRFQTFFLNFTKNLGSQIILGFLVSLCGESDLIRICS